MHLSDNKDMFGLVSRLFHWLLACMVGLQFVFIYVKGFLVAGTFWRIFLMQAHQINGTGIFVLAIGFIVWRLCHRRPPLPETLTPIEKILAHSTHALLFIILLVKPITGYFLSLAKHLYIPWLGITNWSGVLAPSDDLSVVWMKWHTYATYAIVLLIGIHFAAVLKHQLILKDVTLYRMLPLKWFKQNLKDDT